jgi:hypothetical protein
VGLYTKDAVVASGMMVMVLRDILEPVLLLASKLTFRNPEARYLWDGFCSMLVDPSPKSHLQEVGLPVEASTNWTVCPSVGNLGPYVKDTLRSLVRAAARTANRLLELVLMVCAIVTSDKAKRQTTKGQTLAMDFLRL